MLIGSTFAWFTDSVTSAGNKIVAGNLDVDLYLWTAEGQSVEITNESAPIFGAGSIAQNNNAETLWEPGKTQVAYLSIKNNGNLDLKYKVAIDVQDVAKELYKVMEYDITPDATFGEVNSWTDGSAVTTGINATNANDVVLKKGEEHFFALSIHMDERAGNEYMDGQVNFDIKLLATQLTSEFDSFDNQYDKFADYDGEISTATALVAALKKGGTYKVLNEITVDEAVNVPAGVEVNLDMNGKSITGTKGRDADNNRIHVIVNNGILTIKDGTVKSAGNDGGSAIYNNAGATLTIEDVTLYGAPQSDPVYEAGVSKPFPSYAVNNYGNAVVNGATVKSYHGAIATGGDGVTVINDADIDVGLGQSTGITSYLIYSYENAQVTVNGGKFAFTKQEIYVNGGNTFCELGTNPIMINGGNYIGTSFSTAAGREYVIKGGTFDKDPSAYVANGYVVTANGDGTFTVKPYEVSTTDELTTALADGKVVKLTGDVSNYSQNITKDAEINLAGNTLALSGSDLKVTGDLAVNGGTVDVSNGYFDLRSTEDKEIVFEDVVFTNTKKSLTYGNSTDRVESAIEFCPEISGVESTIIFRNCTFNNSNVLFEAMSGKDGAVNAVFEKCTFNNLGNSDAIEISNYLTVNITVKDCKFNMVATSNICIIEAMSSSDVTVTFEGNNSVHGEAAVATDASVKGTVDEIRLFSSQSVKMTSSVDTVNGLDTVTVSGIASK
jgi:predicted ribosomally synthesized peptide with SipW-like signal peptide